MRQLLMPSTPSNGLPVGKTHLSAYQYSPNLENLAIHGVVLWQATHARKQRMPGTSNACPAPPRGRKGVEDPAQEGSPNAQDGTIRPQGGHQRTAQLRASGRVTTAADNYAGRGGPQPRPSPNSKHGAIPGKHGAIPGSTGPSPEARGHPRSTGPSPEARGHPRKHGAIPGYRPTQPELAVNEHT